MTEININETYNRNILNLLYNELNMSWYEFSEALSELTDDEKNLLCDAQISFRQMNDNTQNQFRNEYIRDEENQQSIHQQMAILRDRIEREEQIQEEEEEEENRRFELAERRRLYDLGQYELEEGEIL